METKVNLEELKYEVEEVLDRYDIPHTNKGVTRLLEEWYENKSSLIEMLEKHPNWDSKKLAIVSIGEEVREPEIGRASNLMFNYLDNIYYEYKNSKSTYQSVISRNINKPYEELKENLDNFSYATYKWLQFDYFKGSIVDLVNNDLKITEEEYEMYKEKEFFTHVKQGQKKTRAFRKIFENLKIDKRENFENFYAQLSDYLSPKKDKYVYVISVHPIDYLMMSYGNSWRSCHMIDDGCYRSGTISYMLDESTVEFYSVTKEEYENDSHTPQTSRRIRRNMFMLSPNKMTLLQSRLYPDNNDYLRKQIREYVSNVVCECLGIENKWTKLTYDSSQCLICDVEGKTHYSDYTCSSAYNDTLLHTSQMKDYNDIDQRLYIGHPRICLTCGYEFVRMDEEYFNCIDCE